MAYQVWSVVFGEQPSASKWNILGTNDAEFNSLIQRLSGGLVLFDSSGNEIIKGIRTASAVNEVQVTNAATTGAPIIEATGGDTNIHLVARAKGNGLLKTSVLRQDNTTGTYKHNSVILTGWGVMTGSSSATNSEAVTYGITFAQRPIVLLSPGGDEAVLSSTYGNGGNSVQGVVAGKVHTITTTGFTAYVGALAAWAAGNGQYYQWIAIGELT